MTPEIVASNPRVDENLGRVAVQRGPIVYCMEELDQPSTANLSAVSIVVNSKSLRNFESEYKSGAPRWGYGVAPWWRGERECGGPGRALRSSQRERGQDAAGESDAHSILRLGQPSTDVHAGLDSCDAGLRLGLPFGIPESGRLTPYPLCFPKSAQVALIEWVAQTRKTSVCRLLNALWLAPRCYSVFVRFLLTKL